MLLGIKIEYLLPKAMARFTPNPSGARLGLDILLLINCWESKEYPELFKQALLIVTRLAVGIPTLMRLE